MNQSGVKFLVVVLPVVSAACGSNQTDNAAAAAAEWSVSAEPASSITGDESIPETLVTRVVAASRLNGGGTLLVGPTEVLVYDPSGRFLRRVGRRGEGPGEFVAIQRVQRIRGDSLYLIDATQRRLTVVGPSAEVGRMVGETPAVVHGVFDDGLLLAGLPHETPMVGSGQVSLRGTSRLVALTEEGVEAVQIAIVPGDEVLWHERIGRAIMVRDLLRRSLIAVSGSTVYVAQNDEPTIRTFSRTGEELESIDIPMATSSFSVDDLVAETPELQAMVSAQDLRPAFDEARVRPFIRNLHIDTSGALWIEFVPLQGATTKRIAALDDEGSIEAWTNVRSNLRILEIGDDYFLGAQLDDLGIDTIHMYELIRDSSE